MADVTEMDTMPNLDNLNGEISPEHLWSHTLSELE